MKNHVGRNIEKKKKKNCVQKKSRDLTLIRWIEQWNESKSKEIRYEMEASTEW